MKPGISILLLTSFFLGSGVAYAVINVPPSSNTVSVKVTVCDDYVTSGFPGKPKSEVMLEDQIFYVFADYDNLSPGNHKYRCEIRDGAGNTLLVRERELQVESADFWNVTSYSPNRFSDDPGLWTISIFLDEVMVSETSLTVNKHSAPSKVMAFVMSTSNYSSTGSVGGGNYLTIGLEAEPLPNNFIAARIAAQLFPKVGQDELVTFSYSRYLFGRKNLYSSMSLLYSNSIRTMNSGMVGVSFTPFESWDTVTPNFYLFPVSLQYDISRNEFLFGYEVFGLRVKF